MIPDIITLLSSYSTITDIVPTDRIYPDHISQSAPLPAISMGLVSDNEEMTQDGPTGAHDSVLQLDCWSNSHPEAIAIAKAIKNAINGYDGTVDSTIFDHIVFDSEVHLFEEPEEGGYDWTYHVALDFHIFWQENL